MSPYDDTIIIDTDYLINSRNLLRVFDLPSDFVKRKTLTVSPWFLEKFAKRIAFQTVSTSLE
jgi:hypothetical protein